MRRRKLIALLVALAVFFTPFAPEFAAWAQNSQSGNIEAARNQFQDVYNQIMALEPVNPDAVAGAILDATSWVENAVSDKPDVDYKAQIAEANSKIEEAKTKAQGIMDQLNSGGLDEASSASAVKTGESIRDAANSAKIYQEAMCKAGNALVNVGSFISDLGAVIGVVGAVLGVISLAFPPSAVILAPAAAIMLKVATAMGIVGPLIKAAGEGLIEVGEKGITSDAGLLSTVGGKVAVEGAKQVLIQVATRGLGKVAGNLVEKLGSKSSLLQKAFDPKGSLAKWINNSDFFKQLSIRKNYSNIFTQMNSSPGVRNFLKNNTYGDLIIEGVQRGGTRLYEKWHDSLPEASPVKQILPSSNPGNAGGYAADRFSDRILKPAEKRRNDQFISTPSVDETPKYQKRKDNSGL